MAKEGMKQWATGELAALSGGGMVGNVTAAGTLAEAGTTAKTVAQAGESTVETGNSVAVTGIDQATANQILSIPKGSRPDPATYLSQSYIDSHLAPFNNGVTKIMADAPTGAVGPPAGTFVMPSSVADSIIAQAGGNVNKLEQLLGLPAGSLGTNPVRVDISAPSGLRMPSGNEPGANSQWLPGGYTSGGIPEAVVDPAQPGQYTTNQIFK
jgi:hypothetical protein